MKEPEYRERMSATEVHARLEEWLEDKKLTTREANACLSRRGGKSKFGELMLKWCKAMGYEIEHGKGYWRARKKVNEDAKPS